jgi:predicted SAM-dependent methyltransferase
MASRLIAQLSFLVASFKRRRRFRPPPGPVKINLGAGVNVASSWINIDVNASALIASLPSPLIRLLYRASSAKKWETRENYVAKLKNNVFIHHNLAYGIPLSNESADYIYSSHFFEHLYRDDAERLFRDAHRVLKTGGVFRVHVPSLEPHLAAFARGETEAGLDGFFARSAKQEGGELGRHRYMYDFGLLARLLREAGFPQVSQCERKQGTVPDLDFLEKWPVGLYVEATK